MQTFTDIEELDRGALLRRLREITGQWKDAEARCAKLQYKVDDLLRRLYGPKSEKLNRNQLVLFGLLPESEAVSSQPAALPIGAGDAHAPVSKKRGGGRRSPPQNLPVKREVIDVPEDKRVGMVVIREEVTRQIEYKPSRFYIQETVRLVYAHPGHLQAPIVAPLPMQVLPQASVGPGFITHVVIAKYLDHIPLYRQERIDARAGVWVGRQARCRYIEAAAHLLITIHQQLKHRILDSRYVQVDETFTKLMDGERRGKTRDAYLWGFHAPREKALVMEFSRTRSASVLHGFFPPKWKGDVQSDGAAMYPSAFKKFPDVTHFECLAHLRRHVLDALKAGETEALLLLKDITLLYRIEDQACKLGLGHVRRGCYRHAKAKPILKVLQRRFQDLALKPLFGKLREAVTYANGRWANLMRYAKCGNGHVHVDQNPIERCFRPTKVGLRNYLFIGHPDAGWRSAVIYSVIGTCRLLGVNAESYIAWVLPRLAAATNKTAVNLLPHDFLRLHPDQITVNAHSPSS